MTLTLPVISHNLSTELNDKKRNLLLKIRRDYIDTYFIDEKINDVTYVRRIFFSRESC